MPHRDAHTAPITAPSTSPTGQPGLGAWLLMGAQQRQAAQEAGRRAEVALRVAEEALAAVPAVPGLPEAVFQPLPPIPAGSPYAVTAIVSAYRSTRFLRGCLEDLLAQTLHAQGRLEIVVVDTGSPEDEEAIVREFLPRTPHLRYLRTEDRRTLYAAWNLGALAARGRYLTNANADDRHRADALEVMAAALDASPEVGLVYADSLVTEVENDTFATTSSHRRMAWGPFSVAALRRQCFMGPHPMWRRALHERFGLFDADFTSAGDWEFWVRVGRSVPMQKVDDCLGLYFLNPQGLEHGNARAAAEARQVWARYSVAPWELTLGPNQVTFDTWQPALAGRAARPSAPEPTAPRPVDLHAGRPVGGGAAPTVTVVLLAEDGPAEAARCLAALGRDGPDRPAEVVLVDASPAGLSLAGPAPAWLRQVRVAPSAGRAAALAAGAAAASGSLLVFLHADAEPQPGWLAPLVAAAGGAVPGVAGSRVAFPDGTVVDGLLLAYARPFPLSPVPQLDTTAASGSRGALPVPAVPGVCLALPASLLARLGGFDPSFTAGGEDVDLCLRAGEAGVPVLVARASVVRHQATCPRPRPGQGGEDLLGARWLGRVPLVDAGQVHDQVGPPPRQGRPPVSAVVSLLDAGAAAPRFLEALLRALGPGDELVLADAGSRDGTAALARLLAAEAPGRRRLVAVPGRDRSEAVRAGLAAATRPLAALLPLAETVPDGLLDELTRLLQEHPELDLLAFPAPPAGLVAAGRQGALRTLAAAAPGIFLAGDAGPLRAAAAGRDLRVAVLG